MRSMAAATVWQEGIQDSVLALARRGDLEAFEQLFRAYERPVYNLARRVLGVDEDAEEVLQETFLEVHESLSRFRGEGTLWGWIRSIAASKALMRLRRERLRRTEPYDESGGEDGVGPVVGVQHSAQHSGRPPGPAARLDLEQALDLLDAVPRAVVWLHDVEGYTHLEIAEMMGKSASFSKSQLSRAHARLRLWLGGGA